MQGAEPHLVSVSASDSDFNLVSLYFDSAAILFYHRNAPQTTLLISFKAKLPDKMQRTAEGTQLLFLNQEVCEGAA